MKTRKTLCAVLVAAIAMIGLAACEKEEYGYAPTYGKIYCVNSNPVVGDTLELAVEIKDPGNRCYKAEYVWKGDNGDFYKTVTMLDPLLDCPRVKFVPTHSGTISFTMNASFKLSMPSVNGQIAAFANTSGSIKVNPKP